MDFEVVGEISEIETIAQGKGIKSHAKLTKRYGRGRWRKRKGVGQVKLNSGAVVRAELHWYEAHGIGKRGLKIKRFL
jgi:CRISPR/Cas system CSM-associated protein Csm3 (group 7 of RAMP superfamily)